MKKHLPWAPFCWSAMLLCLLCGCAHTNSHPANSVRIVSTQPATPATLHPGDHMKVQIRYVVSGPDPVLIFARPYAKGEKPDGYAAHPSYPYSTGEGETTGWFTFVRPTQIDEVRVQMLDARNKAVLAEASVWVQATWK